MDKQIKEKELAVLRDYGNTRLRVVAWNDQEPVIEKRYMFKTGGGVQSGRVKGLDLADMEYVVTNWERIKDLMTRGA